MCMQGDITIRKRDVSGLLRGRQPTAKGGGSTKRKLRKKEQDRAQVHLSIANTSHVFALGRTAAACSGVSQLAMSRYVFWWRDNLNIRAEKGEADVVSCPTRVHCPSGRARGNLTSRRNLSTTGSQSQER